MLRVPESDDLTSHTGPEDIAETTSSTSGTYARQISESSESEFGTGKVTSTADATSEPDVEPDPAEDDLEEVLDEGLRGRHHGEIERRGERSIRIAAVVAFLYLFLVGVSVLEAGIEALGAGFEQGLFNGVTNPLAGLFVGVLATVLVQSSSVTTSTIVGLVAAGTLSVSAAIPMVMGANIGTTVTNTLASLGHVRDTKDFRRAFAAATMHDFFNILAVAILLPLQLATGFLSKASDALATLLIGTRGAEYKSPIKAIVKAPVGWIEELLESIGLSGRVLGIVMLVIGLGFIFLALAVISKNMRQLVAERFEHSLNRVLGNGAGLPAMGIGAGMTVAVQSSSITTSVMVPLAATNVVTLQNIYPVVLGANVGTTVTALLAAFSAGGAAALTVALAHMFFNICGILILYPIPAVRRIPISMAQWLAGVAARRRWAAFAYVVGAFIVVPVVGLAILR